MDEIRVGIIGTGGISQGHIERLNKIEGVRITALCDIRPEALTRTKSKHAFLESVPTFDNYEALLASKLTDAVVICTPHTLHHEQSIQCLKAGQHVLSEKPLVCTIAHAHEVIAEIEKSGKVFVLNYQRHYQPEFLYIHNEIKSGKYGEVQFVQGLQCQEWYVNCAGSWRHDPALSGGGQLNDSGSHLLAVLLFITGLSVESVASFIDNLDVPVDINSALSIRFKGGAQGNISVVGNAPCWYEDITIWCAKGIFFMRNGVLEVCDANGKRHKPEASELPVGSNPDVNFIEAMRKEKPIGSPALWGLRVIELTEAAWISAESGKIVTL